MSYPEDAFDYHAWKWEKLEDLVPECQHKQIHISCEGETVVRAKPSKEYVKFAERK